MRMSTVLRLHKHAEQFSGSDSQNDIFETQPSMGDKPSVFFGAPVVLLIR